MRFIAFALVSILMLSSAVDHADQVTSPILPLREEALSNDTVVCSACDASPNAIADPINSSAVDLTEFTQSLAQSGVKPTVGFFPSQKYWAQDANAVEVERR
ncbi:hypothetical protein [Sphingomonas oligophenolica]|uniref:Uncharacterized protein n=1 Tax=Sphingomonas oligophenolica TaxID=301154 RepID=A0A502C1E9_9SPHN|nr:hypothetical protein [Sphingomonas oligophenolica]TPG06570.1 hypothetical protein EAH84_14695 [Sphingomonas oligophenolica]